MISQERRDGICAFWGPRSPDVIELLDALETAEAKVTAALALIDSATSHSPLMLRRVRAALTDPPKVDARQSDYLLDGSPEAVALVRKARGLDGAP